MKFSHTNVKHSLLFLGALFLLVISAKAQSGWTKKKGEYYAKYYITYGSSNDYYTLSGNKINTARFTQIITGFYGEYGLTDRLTLLSLGPVAKQQYFETTEKITGIGDWPIGIKYGLLQGNLPVSLGFVVDVPIARPNNYAQNKDASLGQINLPTGDGEWNYKLTLAASHSFYPKPFYVSVFSTYNYRTQYNSVSYSDQLINGLEVGGSPIQKIWLIAKLHTQSSLGKSQTVDFVRGEGTEFTSFQLDASYLITSYLGINATFFSYNNLIVNRKNLYSANVITIGVSYEIKK